MRVSTSRSLPLQRRPAHRRPICPTKCRMTSSRTARSAAGAPERQGTRDFTTHVGSRQRCWSSAAKRNPEQLAGRTDNNRWSFRRPGEDPSGSSISCRRRDHEAMPNSLRGRLVVETLREFSTMTRDLVLARWTTSIVELCGPLDQHLHQIEARLGVEVKRRGNRFQIIGMPPHQARRSGASDLYTRASVSGDSNACISLQALEMDGAATAGRGPWTRRHGRECRRFDR